MNTQDIIDALSEQRNSALNEVVLLKAKIAQMTREAKEQFTIDTTKEEPWDIQ
jgi:hypothetical protein